MSPPPPPFIDSGRVSMTILRSTLALARSAKNINGRQYVMYSTWQVREMTVDNLDRPSEK